MANASKMALGNANKTFAPKHSCQKDSETLFATVNETLFTTVNKQKGKLTARKNIGIHHHPCQHEDR